MLEPFLQPVPVPESLPVRAKPRARKPRQQGRELSPGLQMMGFITVVLIKHSQKVRVRLFRPSGQTST